MHGDLCDHVDCVLCHNKGVIYLYDKNSGRAVVRACECMKKRRTVRALQRSGLSGAIERCTFSNYKADEEWQKIVKNRALSFIADCDEGNTNKSRCFFIGGQSGCGKTHICTAMSTQLINAGKDFKYMLWVDEVKKLKARCNEDYFAEIMDKLKKVSVLYIDDLFKKGRGKDGENEQPTSADIEIAYEILNYRYIGKGYITIISSERTLADILSVDSALGGRIKEMCGKSFALSIRKDERKNYRLKDLETL